MPSFSTVLEACQHDWMSRYLFVRHGMPSVSYLLGEDSECSPCGSVRHGVPNDDFHFKGN